MNANVLKILQTINEKRNLSQREIAFISKLSLGTINNGINYLYKDGYIEINDINEKKKSYEITKKGKLELENSLVKTAVILAAGMGSRLNSVTNDKIPKGFININGKSLIERSIDNLLNNGIKKIFIVTGHLCEIYDELAKKYDNVFTIKNEYYEKTGSMASLAKMYKVVEDDFILLESDIIYEDRAIKELQNSIKCDCVLISGMTNSGDEVYVQLKDDLIYKMSKDKHSLNSIDGEMVGISKISKMLFEKMMYVYNKSTNNQYHYEYAIEDASKNYSVGYLKIDDLIWGEIDDANHLARVNNIILPKMMSKEGN